MSLGRHPQRGLCRTDGGGSGGDTDGNRLRPPRDAAGELAGGRGARQRPPGRRQRGLLPEILDRVESIGAQLSAIEQNPGLGPETSLAEDLRRLGEQIGQLRDLLTQQGTDRKKGAA